MDTSAFSIVHSFRLSLVRVIINLELFKKLQLSRLTYLSCSMSSSKSKCKFSSIQLSFDLKRVVTVIRHLVCFNSVQGIIDVQVKKFGSSKKFRTHELKDRF